MKLRKIGYLILLITMTCSSCGKEKQDQKNLETDDMMIRISEIEVDPTYLDEYLAILKEEAEASVRLEPGVISIYQSTKERIQLKSEF